MEDMVEYISLDQEDGSDKGDANHVTLAAGIIQPTAAMFASCIEEVDILLENALEVEVKVKRISDEKLVVSRMTKSHASTSSSTEAQGATDTRVEVKDCFDNILGRVTGRPPTLQVVPITGMGGIGKTTLARAVFEDPRTVLHFDVRLLETVSQEYNVGNILRGLLPDKGKEDDTIQVLTERLYKHLYGRRYLIVVDDMWDEEVWDKVQNAFPKEDQGSRVILTTRLVRVAIRVATYVGGSSDVHEMPLLNEEQSWDLLQGKVYGGLKRCPSELEYIGKTISKNCKGLPLTIVVIAGLLKFNTTREYWEEVAKSTRAKATGNDDSLLEILSLSYTNLPAQLKACFLYLGFYPEDSEIPTTKLVKLWSAEGFLEPRESETVEEAGERCLEELVERNLLLVKEKVRYNGKIKTSIIHDVLRDLSLRQAQAEKFLLYFTKNSDGEDALRKIIIRERRVSFSQSHNLHTSFGDCDVPVRTLLNDRSMQSGEVQSNFMRFKLLRVLGSVTISQPSCIHMLTRLTNLRYLHLNICLYSGTMIVPESISKLRNLETLIITGWRGRWTDLDHTVGLSVAYSLFLPLQIWEISCLKHLALTNRCYLPFPVSDYSRLESLHTLSGLTNCQFTPGVISKISNLKKLKLEFKFYAMDDGQVFRLNNLCLLSNLEELSINRDEPYGGTHVIDFAFPDKLKKLSLRRTLLSLENVSIISSLPNLEVLKLRRYSLDVPYGEAWETSDGEFLELKYLELEDLHLYGWRAESTDFPSLEKLFIHDCYLLDEVPADIGGIVTLESLIVRGCRPSAVESVRRIHEEQQNLCNYSLQVIIDGQKLPSG